ncbi:hypothetical protein ISH60_11455 [Pseudomonas aeruginosa]|nr:hypothetical protein [Pseudomonas aeruginosa]
MSNELTDVRCPCGDEYPADSYDAGFIAGSGMCQNCDAALPPKDICTCPSGDGSLRWPCPKHPAVEQAGGDERDLQGAQGERDGWGPLPIVQVPWNVFDQAVMWVEDRRRYGDDGTIVDDWKALKTIQRAALAQPSPAPADEKPGDSILCSGCFAKGVGPEHFDEAGKCLVRQQTEPLGAEFAQVLSDNLPELLSTAQAEQAEAERPEVVGYLATAEHPKHGQPHKAFNYFKDQHDAQVAHWRERGCEVSDDELMTVAQHGRIVGALRARNEKLEADAGALEWLRSTFKVHKAIVEQAGCGTIEQLAEQRDAANSRLHEVSVACATAEQERDAALARVAELERELSNEENAHTTTIEQRDNAEHWADQLANAIAERFGVDIGEHSNLNCPWNEALVWMQQLPAQAQHSVPEEFSFEYRHPNGECHTVTVSREQVINEMPDFLFEALCSKFCNCEPVGETNVVECCCDEYAEEFKLIAAAPGKEVGHE